MVPTYFTTKAPPITITPNDRAEEEGTSIRNGSPINLLEVGPFPNYFKPLSYSEAWCPFILFIFILILFATPQIKMKTIQEK